MNTIGKHLMDIHWDAEAVVVSRPNRFVMIADVTDVDGSIMRGERVHVHDPGRLKEIIYPGNKVRLRKADKSARSTNWTLISGMVKDEWVLANSSLHRRISESILSDNELSPIEDIVGIRPEVKVGSSRIDFLLTKDDKSKCYVEVKGCSLSIDGRALFPDAPTTRGKRHVEELMGLSRAGDMSAIIFLVLAPGARVFSPNRDTDPDFADALEKAHMSGVKIFPVDLNLDGRGLHINGMIPLEFQ